MEPPRVREATLQERDVWNQAVADLPTGHVLQSFEWGELKEGWGWRSHRLLWESQGQVKGAALALRRQLPLPGMGIMYVPKGPCFCPEDSETLRGILRALKGLAHAEGCLFLKVDPDLTVDCLPALEVLVQEGFQPSPEQVQLRNTMVVDLRPPEKEILARMSQSTRRNISLAQRNGVEVVEGGAEDLALFYDLYLETARRDRFILRSRDYYQQLWKLFLERGMAQAFFARWQGQVLAGCLVLCMGKKSWYLLGASRGQMREVKPNQLLQWEAIRWAKAHGAESYDMWGLPDVLEPGHPMWGLYQFKRGFGGELRSWVGAYDYVARPFWRRLWLRAFPLYLRLRGGLAGPLGGEGAAAGDAG